MKKIIGLQAVVKRLIFILVTIATVSYAGDYYLSTEGEYFYVLTSDITGTVNVHCPSAASFNTIIQLWDSSSDNNYWYSVSIGYGTDSGTLCGTKTVNGRTVNVYSSGVAEPNESRIFRFHVSLESAAVADTDGDGLIDEDDPYPFSSDGDGDGYSDLVELMAGSDPTDATSTPDNVSGDSSDSSDPFYTSGSSDSSGSSDDDPDSLTDNVYVTNLGDIEGDLSGIRSGLSTRLDVNLSDIALALDAEKEQLVTLADISQSTLDAAEAMGLDADSMVQYLNDIGVSLGDLQVYQEGADSARDELLADIKTAVNSAADVVSALDTGADVTNSISIDNSLTNNLSLSVTNINSLINSNFLTVVVSNDVDAESIVSSIENLMSNLTTQTYEAGTNCTVSYDYSGTETSFTGAVQSVSIMRDGIKSISETFTDVMPQSLDSISSLTITLGGCPVVCDFSKLDGVQSIRNGLKWMVYIITAIAGLQIIRRSVA